MTENRGKLKKLIDEKNLIVLRVDSLRKDVLPNSKSRDQKQKNETISGLERRLTEIETELSKKEYQDIVLSDIDTPVKNLQGGHKFIQLENFLNMSQGKDECGLYEAEGFTRSRKTPRTPPPITSENTNSTVASSTVNTTAEHSTPSNTQNTNVQSKQSSFNFPSSQQPTQVTTTVVHSTPITSINSNIQSKPSTFDFQTSAPTTTTQIYSQPKLSSYEFPKGYESLIDREKRYQKERILREEFAQNMEYEYNKQLAATGAIPKNQNKITHIFQNKRASFYEKPNNQSIHQDEMNNLEENSWEENPPRFSDYIPTPKRDFSNQKAPINDSFKYAESQYNREHMFNKDKPYDEYYNSRDIQRDTQSVNSYQEESNEAFETQQNAQNTQKTQRHVNFIIPPQQSNKQRLNETFNITPQGQNYQGPNESVNFAPQIQNARGLNESFNYAQFQQNNPRINETLTAAQNRNENFARESFLRRLRTIPKFNGDSFTELREFIDVSETLFNSCINENEENEFYEQMMLQLRGEAKNLISRNPNATWAYIRESLLKHFSFLSNKDILTSQLENLYQEKDESLSKYTERARRLLREKNSIYTNLSEDQRSEHNRLARRAFSKGIRDNVLRNRMITRGASSLEDAISYALEAENDFLNEIPNRELYCGSCRINGHREKDCRRKNNDKNGVDTLISALRSLGNSGRNNFNNNQRNFGQNRSFFNRNRSWNGNNNNDNNGGFNRNWNNNGFNRNWNNNGFNRNWNNNGFNRNNNEFNRNRNWNDGNENSNESRNQNAQNDRFQQNRNMQQNQRQNVRPNNNNFQRNSQVNTVHLAENQQFGHNFQNSELIQSQMEN